MPVPDFRSLTLPVLQEFADGLEHPTKDIRQLVAQRLRLTPDELAEALASGHETRFANRVAWACVERQTLGGAKGLGSLGQPTSFPRLRHQIVSGGRRRDRKSVV
jgi:restriction endonuclease Mrr